MYPWTILFVISNSVNADVNTSTVQLVSRYSSPVNVVSNARVLVSFGSDGIFVPSGLLLRPYKAASWESYRLFAVGGVEENGRLRFNDGSMMVGTSTVELQVTASRFIVGGTDLVKVVEHLLRGDPLMEAVHKAHVISHRCTMDNQPCLEDRIMTSQDILEDLAILVLDTQTTRYVNITLGKVEIIRSSRFPCTLWTNAHTITLNGKDITLLLSQINDLNPSLQTEINETSRDQLSSIRSHIDARALHVKDGETLLIEQHGLKTTPALVLS